MNASEVMIPCPCCGTGSVKLIDVMPGHAGTLDLLTRVVTPVCTPVLFEVQDASNRYIKLTALNNRLAKLEALGLVKSERRGKSKYWEVVK